jgi:ribosomal protein S18 acetylase RimI-like enzyme
MQEITARDAAVEDIPAMLGLLEQLYTLEPQFAFDEVVQREGLKLCIENPGLGRIILVTLEGKVIALANLQFSVSTAMGGLSLHIDDFVVDDDFRGKGVGTLLMDAIATMGKQMGAVRVTVNVDVANDRGLAFYRKAGFASLNLMRHQLVLADN